MQDIVDNEKLQMRGIVGLYAANAVGDDIEVYKDDSRTDVLCRSVLRPPKSFSMPACQAQLVCDLLVLRLSLRSTLVQ